MAPIDERVKLLIQARLDRAGMVAHEWRDGDDGTEALLGRYAAFEDDDSAGLYEGDEGELSAYVVGAQRYHNERVMFGLQVDGTDCAIEVSLDTVEAA